MTKSRYVGKYVKPRLTSAGQRGRRIERDADLAPDEPGDSTSTSDSPKVSSSGSSGERP